MKHRILNQTIMKSFVVTMSILFLTFNVCWGQGQIQRICKTCKKPIAECKYVGQHPNGSKMSPYKTAMNKGKSFYSNYNYAAAIKYYGQLFSKFPTHSTEIRNEIEKCEKIVSCQARFAAMTPELALALKKYTVKNSIGNGLVPVEKDGLCGFINLKGEEVIPCRYKNVESFHEGVARVGNSDGQTAFIDTVGNIIIPFSKQEKGRHFHKGFVGVKTSEGMGFMDLTGNITFSGKIRVWNYDCVFSEGVTAVMVGDNMYAYMNEFGDNRVEPFHAYSAYPYYHDVAPVRIDVNGKVRAALLDKFGGVWKTYEDFFDIRPFSEGLSCMVYAHNGNSKKYRVVFIDEKGRPVLVLPYHDCGNFNNGLAYYDKEIAKGWKYGYINKKGEIIINAIYDYACDFSEGFALVKKGNQWGLIDVFGNCSMSYR